MKKMGTRIFASVMALFLFIPFVNADAVSLDTNYAVQEANIQRLASLTDDIKLEQLAQLFFSAKEESFLSADDINLTTFYSPRLTRSSEESSYSKLFTFEKAVRQASPYERLYEDFDVTIQDISINGDTATVTAYEYLEYVLKDFEDIVSSRGVLYYIDYIKTDGEWKICNIRTNNELESLVSQFSSSNELLDVCFTDAAPVADPALDVAREMATIPETSPATASSLSKHTYSAVKAINYALDHADSDSYNTLFAGTSGDNDCQNFVSQCLWAGFGGVNSGIESKDYPMIVTSGREWWRTSSTNSADNIQSWTRVSIFSDYLESGGSNKAGLYGTLGNVGSIANAYAGDLLQICHSASQEDYYHTYIISRASGTSGSRGTNNLWVCAHTTDRNNELLSEIVGSASLLRVVVISGSYW